MKGSRMAGGVAKTVRVEKINKPDGWGRGLRKNQ
jgi:hypothetical protein